MAVNVINLAVGTATSYGLASSGSLPSSSFDPGSGDCVIMALHGQRAAAVSMSFTPTLGGVSMTAQGSVIYGNGSTSFNTFFQWWVLTGVSSGSKTIGGGWSSSSGSSPTIRTSILSYSGVGSIAGPQTVTGTEAGTALSQVVTSAINDMIVQCFIHEPISSTPVSSYNQTQLLTLDTDTHCQGVVGQALASSTSTTFTAVRSSGANYLETALVLTPGGGGPPPPTNTSSMFLVM